MASPAKAENAVHTPEPTHKIVLPDAPAHISREVKAWCQDVSILTYLPERPDPNPMFLEKRVYQGSSGRIYPLPFIDRIAVEPREKLWQALHIENQYLRVMILPEIGGRIHIGYDKTSGYDFFYRQDAIKPALVGLAGPWISGGVEFNWPQHHRPATYMPVETEIEEHADGSVTIWCSDHDPMQRMKGMHGICLRPGSAVLEVKVRLFNRTPFTQTFLWWANVAARVHEQYQSFFPTDVRYVADHAKRATTTFPLSTGKYYGVDYGERGRSGVPEEETPRKFVPDGSYAANDLSRYANIPVPTSYMIAGTEADFFGGYDHRAEAGFVHVANHHVAPGKKQWTWGNHEFGYAWDRNLSEDEGPYIELMAGVYTDNQPDFSYLAPWETKSFTQCWYPIHGIGVPQVANPHVALSLSAQGGGAHIGVSVPVSTPEATVTLLAGAREVARWTAAFAVEEPLLLKAKLPEGTRAEGLRVIVAAAGKTLAEYCAEDVVPARAPVVAQEPLAPEQIASVEELYLTGVHLEQYRHATREPELYWQEILRRDSGESRAHNALGRLRLRRGEFEQAVEHFEAAIARLTRLNPNPYDGEPYYNLGLARRYQGKEKEAYDAFYKATWNAAWRGPAYFALAELDAKKQDWKTAEDHLHRSLAAEAENLAARNLLAMAYRHLGKTNRADELLRETLALDPMDLCARWFRGIVPTNGQALLDLAFDFLRAGQDEEARKILLSANFAADDGSVPMILLTLADIEATLMPAVAEETYCRAQASRLDYCFPSRLEEMLVLERTVTRHPKDGLSHFLLGNLLYDRRRYAEAIEAWEKASVGLPSLATVWRNLGIAYFNQKHDAARAAEAFDRAFEANSKDARVLYERDQLWKRLGRSPDLRLPELLKHPHLVELRDDLSVEQATLYNQLARPEDALAILLNRRFQPWEGGEGLVLGQYVRTRLLLGRRALRQEDSKGALEQFHAALHPPLNLSEAKHLLANQSDIYYWVGVAYQRDGKTQEAQSWWQRAARQKGDFQQMSVRAFSEMSYWSAMALQQLGETKEADELLRSIHAYSIELEATTPKIDYFATSLPSMLLFEEDLARRNTIEARFLRAQALAGMKKTAESAQLLNNVLSEDRNHSGAADLLRQIQDADAAGGRS